MNIIAHYEQSNQITADRFAGLLRDIGYRPGQANHFFNCILKEQDGRIYAGDGANTAAGIARLITDPNVRVLAVTAVEYGTLETAGEIFARRDPASYVTGFITGWRIAADAEHRAHLIEVFAGELVP